MIKTKSTVQDQGSDYGAIVSLPRNRKKGKSIDYFIEKTVGKEGSEERKTFEIEFKLELLQEAIKEARKIRHLSQEQLGEKIGVKKAQISKLEKGYNNTTIGILTKVLDALDAKVKITIELENQHLEFV
ncbi:helix-turn-helix domain-containing protein [Solitalea lacus]|uniref:helix-turn-helix domain-containing protein n=1 Tax=Solitalea lacus TaxID=2911172 RepID=UPI001ED9F2E4|nr:helix-turn-helix transcriptional regulator [Solitalea lacus]UKJ09163.1 helix-turn-helix domain-containing protein [Solitalea lacus]